MGLKSLCYYVLPVKFHSQYSIAIGVVADLGPFLKMANLEFSGGREWHNGDKTAAEQPLDNARIFSSVAVDLFELIDIIQREQPVAVPAAHRQRPKFIYTYIYKMQSHKMKHGIKQRTEHI